MTPAQMQELTSPQNIWGRTPDGRVLYRCFIQNSAAWQRVQQLTTIATDQVPPWHVLTHDGTGWWIITTEPAWFVDLEKEIINAYRYPR